MKRFLKIILIFFIFLNTNVIFALEPIPAQLGKIENSLWGIEYKKENESARLKRIEEEVFGVQSNIKSAQERINKINESLGLEGTAEEINAVRKEVDDIQAQGVSYPAVDRIEMQVFGKNYNGEGIYSRLDRLENKLYSAKQSGDLNQRVERLSSTITVPAPTQIQQQPNNFSRNYYNDYSYNNSDMLLQIAGLESTIFRKTYDQDPLSVRLNRLERKIFQRDFAYDEEAVRLQRIQAAATASKTAKYYDGNKFQKYASTGIQLGTLILMILAFIL